MTRIIINVDASLNKRINIIILFRGYSDIGGCVLQGDGKDRQPPVRRLCTRKQANDLKWHRTNTKNGRRRVSIYMY